MDNYEKRNAREWQGNGEAPVVEDCSDSDECSDDVPRALGTHETFANAVAEPVMRSNPNLAQTKLAKKPLNKVPIPKGSAGAVPRYIRHQPPSSSLFVERDNNAKAAYRRRRPHAGWFKLPKTYDKIDPKSFHEGSSKAGTNPYLALEEIGVRTKSFIRPPKHVADCTLLIWGTKDQVYAANRELEKWVRQAEGNSVVVNRFREMPKITSYTDKMKQDHDRRMQAEALRQKYRKAPKDGVAFACMGSFLWPAEEHFRPEELLGPSYEALDAIRTYCQCYVIFDSRTSLFKIMSDNPPAVRDAIQRIGVAVCEFTTRKSRPIEIYLIEPPTLATVRADVALRPVAVRDDGGNADKADLPMVPTLAGAHLPQPELTQWAGRGPDSVVTNEICMRDVTKDCISSMRFYRGRIRMRVHFGTFALTDFRRPKHNSTIPFEEFLRDMRLPDTRGKLIKDLQATKEGQDLVTRCCLATNIFRPADALIPTLEEVVPVYTAMFEFRHQDTGHVRLEVGMTKGFGTDGHYEVSHKQWTRIEKPDQPRPGNDTASPPLEVFMVRLHSAISWKLQISVENNVSETRITPAMKDFAERVQFNEPLAGTSVAATAQRLFKYGTNLSVDGSIQKTAWQYRLKNENAYTFEIARYDTFSGSYSKTTARTPSSSMTTRWGASLYSKAWDTTFSENASLAIGETAKWNPALETFFPEGILTGTSGANAGFHNFLQDVHAVAEVLDEKWIGGPL